MHDTKKAGKQPSKFQECMQVWKQESNQGNFNNICVIRADTEYWPDLEWYATTADLIKKQMTNQW